MAALFRDPGFRILMLDLLFDTPELRGLGDALKEAREELLMMSSERRWSESHRFSPIQVAKAAGVRASLIEKYIREGVRGAGRLCTDDEGNISPFDLEFFASLHSGRAKEVALKALGQLSGELTQKRSVPSAARHTHKPTSSIVQGARICQEKPSRPFAPQS